MTDKTLHPIEIACREAWAREDGYGTPLNDHRYRPFRDGFFAAFNAGQAQRDQLLDALKLARSTIATALKASAPDWFKTDEDVAGHVAVKRIDAAIAAAEGRQS